LKALEAVIFDLDGVVVDSHPSHKRAWKTFFRSLGKEVSERELCFVLEGQKREDILRHFLGELSQEQVRYYGACKEALFRHSGPKLKTIPGLHPFLESLEAAGMALALASSASRSRACYMLKQLDLMRRFRVIVTGDDVDKGKPDPEIFRLAAQGLSVPAESILVCEDAVSGVAAAKLAGMKCLAIAAEGRERLLSEAGADCVLPDFTSARLDELQCLFTRPAFAAEKRQSCATTAASRGPSAKV